MKTIIMAFILTFLTFCLSAYLSDQPSVLEIFILFYVIRTSLDIRVVYKKLEEENKNEK